MLDSDGVVAGCDFIDANLSGFELRRAQCANTLMSYVNLSDADLLNVDLSGSTLEHANLAGADLTDAILGNADLTNANFSGAILTSVYWSDTTCPDGTNSDDDGGTCANNLG